MSRVTLHDTNNLAMRCIHIKDVKTVNKKTKVVTDVDFDYWKYIIFKSVYSSIFTTKATTMVMAIDDKRSWRYDVWSRYKEDRKKKKLKDTTEFPWDDFFVAYEELMDDIKTHLPIKVLKNVGAEADDIIGVISLKEKHQCTAISTDKDYLQLSSDRVKIYNPMKREYVSHPNTEMFLTEQCMCGQSKDSIFNVTTPLDHPEGKRKPGFGPKKFEKVVVYGADKWLDDNNLRERFDFNRVLMDFRCIPQDLQDDIMDDYTNYKYPDPKLIYEFFKKHGWPEYLDDFTNVENNLMKLY